MHTRNGLKNNPVAIFSHRDTGLYVFLLHCCIEFYCMDI